METKTTQQPVIIPEAKFENIPLNKIVVDPNQPRTFFDQHALDELTDSVREKGVLQPILVRPNGKTFMIVCGERRYKAAMSVNAAFKDRNTIPAVIRNINDDEALELQIIENLQRKDVHPMEEAVAFKSLIEHGKDLQEIAAKVGKSEFYARQRMKLNALTEKWQKAFFDGRISNTTALTIALFDGKIQGEIFKSEAEGRGGHIELSKWDLRRYRGELSTAPFDLADPTLDKKMGPCVNCKFNSATAALFPEAALNPQCSNITCFKGKCDTHFIKAFEQAMQDATILFVHSSWGSFQDKYTARLTKAKVPFYGANQYDKVEVPELYDWDEWKEDNIDDYDVSEIELRGIYEKNEVESYKKDLAEYQAKIESGKYKKGFMLDGQDRGKYVYLTLKKSAGGPGSRSSSKTSTATQQVTAADITEEIQRIQIRDKRNQELDMEKVHVAMLEQLEKSSHLKVPGLAMQDIDRGILVYLLIKAGGYHFDKVVDKIPGLPKEPDHYRNRYKFTPEYFEQLSKITDEQLAFIIRKLAFDKYGNKNLVNGINPEDTVSRLMASYMGVDILAIEKAQKVIAHARHEKVGKKIELLAKKRSELKTKKVPAKKK